MIIMQLAVFQGIALLGRDDWKHRGWWGGGGMEGGEDLPIEAMTLIILVHPLILVVVVRALSRPYPFEHLQKRETKTKVGNFKGHCLS